MKTISSFIRIVSFLAIVSGIFCILPVSAKEGTNFYKRNFIIIVDQSSPFKNKQGEIQALYRGMKDFFTGNKIPSFVNADMVPEDFEFNPETDEISFFSFAIDGKDPLHGAWGKIYKHAHRTPGYDGASFVKDVSDNLLHSRVSFSESDLPLKEFLNSNDVRKIFNYGGRNEDELGASFRSKSGISLSHYVYPLILNHIKKESISAEYFIIVLTDYQSGTSFSDSEDLQRIRELAYGKPDLVNSFVSEVNRLKKPFYTTDWLQLRTPGLFANGMQLGIMSLRGVSVYTNPTINLDENYFFRGRYDIHPTEVSFNKNDNIRVDSIYLQFRDAELGLLLANHRITDNAEDAEKWYDKERRLFRIPSQTVELVDSTGKNNIEFEYQFFTTIIPENGKEIPYVLTTQSHGYRASIVYISDKQYNIMIAICIGTVLFILVFIMAWRGRLRKVTGYVHNFTTRFSLTTPKDGTLELPCWFVESGQRTVGLRVDGTVDPVCRNFCLPRKEYLSVAIEDAKVPRGLAICLNNDRDQTASSGKYYPIPLEDGKFRFTVNFWIDQNDFDFSQPSRVKFKLRYKTETKLLDFTSKTQFHLTGNLFKKE